MSSVKGRLFSLDLNVLNGIVVMIWILALEHIEAHFTADFSVVFQIKWKIYFLVFLVLVIQSQQIVAHNTTAVLSWHENFVMRAKFIFYCIWTKVLMKWTPE